ncbi:MAG: hypothetical protein ABI432_05695 [Flavobacteriales bacterium]
MGLLLEARAQGTFNERFDLFGEGMGQFGWGIEVKANGDALVLFNGDYTDDSLYYGSAVSSVVVSPAGVFSAGFRLQIPERATYPGWANCASPRQEGGYILGGSTATWGDTARAALYWLDEDGVVTNFSELDLPGHDWIGRQAKQAADGGFVVVGETSSLETIDAFVAKTDAQGEVEWVKTFGGVMDDYALAVDLRQLGGYFVGGQSRISSSNKQLWVLALDDTGAVAWSKIWGTQYDEPNAHLTTSADGNILVASAWGTSPNDNYAKYLAKLDKTDGAIMWDRTYGPPSEGCPLYAVKEVHAGGDLIAVGHSYQNASYYGVLLRTTSQGDSLWMRYYQYYDSVVTNGRGLLRDVQPTPDGGFVAAGVALGVSGQYTQDVWVIKVDSMGCIEPGCHLVTGVETQLTNLRDALTVSPNPVARGGAISVELKLPQNFTPQGALRLTLVSSDGRLISEQQLEGTTCELARSPLASTTCT